MNQKELTKTFNDFEFKKPFGFHRLYRNNSALSGLRGFGGPECALHHWRHSPFCSFFVSPDIVGGPRCLEKTHLLLIFDRVMVRTSIIYK